MKYIFAIWNLVLTVVVAFHFYVFYVFAGNVQTFAGNTDACIAELQQQTAETHNLAEGAAMFLVEKYFDVHARVIELEKLAGIRTEDGDGELDLQQNAN